MGIPDPAAQGTSLSIDYRTRLTALQANGRSVPAATKNLATTWIRGYRGTSNLEDKKRKRTDTRVGQTHWELGLGAGSRYVLARVPIPWPPT